MVFLALGVAFEGFADGGDGLDQIGVDHIGGRPRAAIAGIGELDDAGGRAEAGGGQLEQPIGGLIAADALEDFLTVPAYEKVLALGG